MRLEAKDKTAWGWLLILTVACLGQGCQSTRQGTAQVETPMSDATNGGATAVVRETFTIVNQLVHTELDVVPDWQREELEGKARLTLHPHFYPTDSLTLDAKGFLIHRVALITPSGMQDLTYAYDSMYLRIKLDRMYQRTDTYTVFIHYTARPNRLPQGGGGAILAEKGLYFINADGSDPYLPRQLWTQGETEFSSAWFPTIDKPNIKTTLKLSVTYDSALVSLSNGLLVSRHNHSDGTRTDTWQLMQPFAPYLVTLVVGPYVVVTDEWRGKEVSYYVEEAYAPYARDIFGRTTRMLDFFSDRLGVPYPWPKYSQVVVRNFVSGAMENVTATTHGSFLHQTRRELIDGNNDDIIAHELFHHWFGNLVTTESWSHLSINESFATYGEYLWNEHYLGADAADLGLYNDLKRYLSRHDNYRKPVVRYQYDNPNDMFDAVSYSKGGCILHLLRHEVGDEAFFAALRLFLQRHAYSTAEIDDLRLAFEAVTGRDLNVFFNQWFFAAGHPELLITPTWNASSGQVWVTVEQLQQPQTGLPVYRLPLTVDVYLPDTVLRFRAVVQQRNQQLVFPCPQRPELINVDAEKVLVGVKTIVMPDSAFAVLYRRGPKFLDRLEAIEHFARKENPLAQEVLTEALNDRFWFLRLKAVDALAATADTGLRSKLRLMAVTDPHPHVRQAALQAVASWQQRHDKALIEFALSDSSYAVVATALNLLADRDAAGAYRFATALETEPSAQLRGVVFEVYARHAGPEKINWLTASLLSADRYYKYSLISLYEKFLLRHTADSAVLLTGISALGRLTAQQELVFIRYAAVSALVTLQKELEQKAGRAVPPTVAHALHERLTAIGEQEKDFRILRLLSK
ncbi:MAG: M1 family aminopeptidase [Chitinophagales bacterium]|nr:M1 family aminopeptidase [Chitinophagales bacterium]MDW8427245.1 M1 family aminopeptidase [Chitinophagales bacterium]